MAENDAISTASEPPGEPAGCVSSNDPSEYANALKSRTIRAEIARNPKKSPQAAVHSLATTLVTILKSADAKLSIVSKSGNEDITTAEDVPKSEDKFDDYFTVEQPEPGRMLYVLVNVRSNMTAKALKRVEGTLDALQEHNIYISDHDISGVIPRPVGLLLKTFPNEANFGNLTRKIVSNLSNNNRETVPRFELYPHKVHCKVDGKARSVPAIGIRAGIKDVEVLTAMLTAVNHWEHRPFGVFCASAQSKEPATQYYEQLFHHQATYLHGTKIIAVHGADPRVMNAPPGNPSDDEHMDDAIDSDNSNDVYAMLRQLIEQGIPAPDNAGNLFAEVQDSARSESGGTFLFICKVEHEQEANRFIDEDFPALYKCSSIDQPTTYEWNREKPERNTGKVTKARVQSMLGPLEIMDEVEFPDGFQRVQRRKKKKHRSANPLPFLLADNTAFPELKAQEGNPTKKQTKPDKTRSGWGGGLKPGGHLSSLYKQTAPDKASKESEKEIFRRLDQTMNIVATLANQMGVLVHEFKERSQGNQMSNEGKKDNLIQELSTRLQEMEGKLTRQEKIQTEQSQHLTEFQAKYTQLVDEQEALKEKYTQLAAEKEELQTENQRVTDLMVDQQNKLRELRQELKKRALGDRTQPVSKVTADPSDMTSPVESPVVNSPSRSPVKKKSKNPQSPRRLDFADHPMTESDDHTETADAIAHANDDDIKAYIDSSFTLLESVIFDEPEELPEEAKQFDSTDARAFFAMLSGDLVLNKTDEDFFDWTPSNATEKSFRYLRYLARTDKRADIYMERLFDRLDTEDEDL